MSLLSLLAQPSSMIMCACCVLLPCSALGTLATKTEEGPWIYSPFLESSCHKVAVGQPLQAPCGPHRKIKAAAPAVLANQARAAGRPPAMFIASFN